MPNSGSINGTTMKAKILICCFAVFMALAVTACNQGGGEGEKPAEGSSTNQ
jgi:predicted small secreted protein